MIKHSQKAIVIGASSGIGRGVAQQLVADGYKVGIMARREQLLADLATETPDAYYPQYLDVAAIDTIEERLKALVERMNGMDLIVISSGIIPKEKTYASHIEDYALRCNVIGFSILLNWSYQYFQQQGKGHIVALSSVAGARGWRTSTQYNASKAFQINYLEGLRIRAKYENLNVQITDIRPGYVQTDIMGSSYTFWVVQVKDVVPSIIRAIRKKKNIAYVPARWRCIYHLYRIIPTWILQKG